MTVFFRPERQRWVYEFVAGGRRYRGNCVDPVTGQPVTSKRRAVEVEAELKARVRRSPATLQRLASPAAFTLAQALSLHISAQAGRDSRHRENLRQHVRELVAFFGEAAPVLAIDHVAIEKYRAFCIGQPLRVWVGGSVKERDREDPRYWRVVEGKTRTAATANRYLATLGAALRAAHKVRDPATGEPVLPFPPTVQQFDEAKRLPTPMPAAEFEKRRKAAPPWTRDAIDLSRLFGMRKGEVLAATVDHVDHERRCLRFRGEETKSGRDELMHGGDAGWALLERLMRQAKERGARHLVTWPGAKGKAAVMRGEPAPKGTKWEPVKSIRRAWRTTAKGERGHRFHDLRASYITELATVASAAVVQEAARHADPSTTRRYIGGMGGAITSAIDAARRRGLGGDTPPHSGAKGPVSRKRAR